MCTPPGRLDTVGICFPISGEFETEGAHATVSDLGRPAESWRYRHALPGGGFLALGVGSKAWVEASLPKRAGGDNVEGLVVAPALEVLETAWAEAQKFCEADRGAGGDRFELAGVVRLDPVRDFEGVGHIGPLLDGLAGVPGRDSRHKVRRFADGERNRAESLRVGPKAWGGQLYDKHAETGGRCEVGRLRFEARMHREQLTSEWAKKEGVVMRQVADISTEKVERLTRSTFERVGFDREVSGVAEAGERVFSLEGWRPDAKAGLWAFLTVPEYSAMVSRNTAQKYRQAARELGLVVGQVLDAEAPAVTARLDFDRGSEVLCAG
jgi:hypothetical protein